MATSTTEMSACRDELTCGVGVWSKAISRPSGDQSNDPTVKASPSGQAAGLGACSQLGHPKVGHAKVGVFDSVVAVAFSALLEVVGSGIGGRERELAAVGRKAERPDAAVVGSEPFSLAALGADEVDLRAVTAVRDEAEAGSVRGPPVPGAAAGFGAGELEGLAAGCGQPDLPVEPVGLPFRGGHRIRDHPAVGRDAGAARRLQRDLGTERLQHRGLFRGGSGQGAGEQRGQGQGERVAMSETHDFFPS